MKKTYKIMSGKIKTDLGKTVGELEYSIREMDDKTIMFFGEEVCNEINRLKKKLNDVV